MTTQSWDIFLNHVLPWIIQTGAAAITAFVAFLILLPTKWGDAYLKHRFARDLEVHKSSLNRDFGKRSNEMEFNAIKLV